MEKSTTAEEKGVDDINVSCVVDKILTCCRSAQHSKVSALNNVWKVHPSFLIILNILDLKKNREVKIKVSFDSIMSDSSGLITSLL